MNYFKKFILVLVFLGLAGGIFWIGIKIYNSFLVGNDGDIQVESQAPLSAADQKYQADLAQQVQAIAEHKLTDSDLDGLTNEEESKLGTDPKKEDTDGDGLLDDQEVNIFHTDPIKRDTDGDGIGDSNEVFAGSDPLKK
ncbi:MAG: hypothetical protein WCX97_02955 [Candidatus Magasanikbacteria bacterium]